MERPGDGVDLAIPPSVAPGDYSLNGVGNAQRQELFELFRRESQLSQAFERSYEMLVIYYIGHGLFQNASDVWMLSGAPGDPAECVNFDTMKILPRMSSWGVSLTTVGTTAF